MQLILTNARGEQVAEFRTYSTGEDFFTVLLSACAATEQLAQRQCAADPHDDALSHRAMLTMEPGCYNGGHIDGVHVVYDATWARPDQGGPSDIVMAPRRTFPESDFAGALEYLMGC